jgi:hypothetical protein
MAEIDVTAQGDGTYHVTVTDQGSSSSHVVTVEPEDASRLGAGASGEELVEASFRFLLDREPRESIMGRFDLAVIGRYFPEYTDRIGDYL